MVWICNLNIHHSDIRKLEYLECYLGYTNDPDMRARKVLAFLVLRKNNLIFVYIKTNLGNMSLTTIHFLSFVMDKFYNDR